MSGSRQSELNEVFGDTESGVISKDRLLTSREAAHLLNMTEAEVISLVSAGKIPAYKIGGEFLRFRKQHLEILRENIDMVKWRCASAGKVVPIGGAKETNRYSIWDWIRDFFCLNDFYVLSLILISLLVFVLLNKK
ncbi:MAG: helix-turn-helix domain-containing protein [Candidatus Omnitrophota bacterium]